MKLVSILVFCCLLAACGGSSIEGGNRPVASQADFERNNISVLAPNPLQDASFGEILNDLRGATGAGPVTFDARLNAAAQAHAEDMVVRGYFSHINPEGRTERDRIKVAGYDPKSWGENLAGGQPSEADALVAWINSAEHNRLLHAQTVDDFGLGVAGSGRNLRWVLLMARER